MGRLTAERLIKRGYCVLLTDVDETVFETAKALNDRSRHEVWAMQQDVRDPTSHKKISAAACAKGKLQVWVNNAGILRAGTSWNYSAADVRLQFEINVLGVIYGCQAAVPAMDRKTGGHIINIASMSALSPVPGLAIYAATKHAVLGFSTSLQGDLNQAKLPIKVSVICPDTTATQLVAEVVSDQHSTFLFSNRLLTPESVADAVASVLDNYALLRPVPRSRGLVARLLQPWPGFTLRAMKVMSERAQKNRDQYRQNHLG